MPEKYKIIRFYRDRNVNRRTIRTGLTLEQARTHCGNPETSSRTCKGPVGRRRTRNVGAWFDGYDKM